MFTTPEKYPFFSAGSDAKGYIAVGMNAKGIVAIGMISQGLFTFSMVGTGIFCFIGQAGGTLGFGIYQVGVAWYCYLGQLSLGLYYTRAAQLGVNILGPIMDRNKKVYTNCEG